MYGVPRRIHSDQVRNFESKLVKDLCSVNGIVKSWTTAYHPQGNGQCTLHNLLRTLPSVQKKRWPEHLQELVFTTARHMHQLACHTLLRLYGTRANPINWPDVWLKEKATNKRKRNDATVNDQGIAIGTRVLLRSHPLGRNKIADQ